MDFCDLKFGRLVDTSEEYIEVIIVHSKVYFFFLLFMLFMYLNSVSYLYGKQIKSKLGNKLYI